MILFDVKCETNIEGFDNVEYTTTSLAAAIQIFHTFYHEIENKVECVDKDSFEKWIKDLPAFFDISEDYECGNDFAHFLSYEDRMNFEIIVYISIDIDDDIPAIVREDMTYEQDI